MFLLWNEYINTLINGIRTSRTKPISCGMTKAYPVRASILCWRRIPESHAKIDVPVPVEVEFASDGAEVRVRYTVDDAVSGWLGICGGGSLHGVEATCRLHALSARYANVLGDGRFAIVLR